MEITLITSNEGKVKEFRAVLEPEIRVNHKKLQYEEMKNDSCEVIAAQAAQRLTNELKKPVVVDDSGLFIEALNGFPGACSAFTHKRIGLEGILTLMKGVKNRKAYYLSAIAYCEPENHAKIFVGKEDGTIAKAIRGNFGFGHDPIFIPDGSTKTYGEMSDVVQKKKFRPKAIRDLKEFLHGNSRR